jgi:allantoin racemase
MRLLLYNPNTDKSLTEKLGAAVRKRLRKDDFLKAVTSDEGTDFIGSDETIAIARASLHSGLSAHAHDCDAILLGCFGDLGVDDIREKLRRPVLSLSDAYFAIAPFRGKRSGVITTSPFWVEKLTTECQLRRTDRWIAEICPLSRTNAPTKETLYGQCRSLISAFAKDALCDQIVLAGAVLTAIVDEMAPNSPLPIADTLRVAIALCRLGHAKAIGQQVTADP